MKIKNILNLRYINENTYVKCYDSKGSLVKPLFEGKFTDSNFMSEHEHEYVVGLGEFDVNKNTLEVFVRIEE